MKEVKRKNNSKMLINNFSFIKTCKIIIVIITKIICCNKNINSSKYLNSHYYISHSSNKISINSSKKEVNLIARNRKI